MADIILTRTVHLIITFSTADLAPNCALYDKSMKLDTWLIYIMKVILRNGAASDLTFVTF